MKKYKLYLKLPLYSIIGGMFTAYVNKWWLQYSKFEVEEPDVTVNFSIANALAMVSGTPTKIESSTPLC